MRKSFTLIFLLFHLFVVAENRKAVTIVPVADLFGNSHGAHAYTALSLCSKPVTACLRIHQLIYNEIVTIEEENGPEVRVSIGSVFYEQKPNGTPHRSYWTLKKNIMTLEELKKLEIPLHTIPEPIDFSTRSIEPQEKIVTLIFPHYDQHTQTTYSAGTRFVQTNAQYNHESVNVYAINRLTRSLTTINIPREKYIISGAALSPIERQKLFVKIVRAWAHQKNGFIPYVWGGCSFTGTMNDPHFVEQTDNKGFTHFQMRKNRHCPHTGLDCTGLVARAAQIAGIPYFLKNTSTIANRLLELPQNGSLEDGDLIWLPGHVIIISDVQENKIVEARAYGQGYGKIHELPLRAVFKDIDTLDQLRSAAHHKKTIYRLQKNGTVAHAITNLRFFKFSSAFNY